MLATYFGDLLGNLPLAVRSGFEALHLDLVRAPQQLEHVIPVLDSATILSLGVVDGRNVWRTDLDRAHAQTRAAVERYANSIRRDAPNADGGTNVDYIVRYNGLRDRDELYETVLATQQWTAFIGFFPGLPFMFPLDPRDAVSVPKYNPTRTWTPEGALGLGGPCFAIYPVESAGGYQLLGRTLPIYDVHARNEAFRDSSLLLRAGDRVRFHRVEEDELLRLFDQVRSDEYRYRIEDSPFDVGAHLDWAAGVAVEAKERAARREQAAAATPVP